MMTWCRYDSRVATVSVCSFETLEGSLALVGTGILTTLYLIHVKSNSHLLGSDARLRGVVRCGGAVALLLLSHITTLAVEAGEAVRARKYQPYELRPSRLFLQCSLIFFYTLLGLLLVFSWTQKSPVPWVQPAAYAFAAFYAIQLAFSVAQNAEGSLPGALMVVSSLQCIATLFLAILAAVTCGPSTSLALRNPDSFSIYCSCLCPTLDLPTSPLRTFECFLLQGSYANPSWLCTSHMKSTKHT